MKLPASPTHYRPALVADIPQLMEVRFAVRENVLRNRALVTEQMYVDYLTCRGRGWVAESAGCIVGFSIIDMEGHSVWALFVHPDYAEQGIGRHLHELMLAWYFAQTTQPIWLSTSPCTRAEGFYRRLGWQDTGRTAEGEVRFERTCLAGAIWQADQ